MKGVDRNNHESGCKVATSDDLKEKTDFMSSPTGCSISQFEIGSLGSDQIFTTSATPTNQKPKHLSTVWDFKANYGGELHTIKWESDLILDISNSIKDLALDVAEIAGKQVLKTTVFATLVNSMLLPAAVYNQIDNLDAEWVLIAGRSKAAGKELAEILLKDAESGRRPVTLVGYSFGALVIYHCLSELVKMQEQWLEHKGDLIAKDAGDLKRQQDLSSYSYKCKLRQKCKSKKETNKIQFECEPASVIEDVVLMGLPKYLNLKKWGEIREIVAGRLVNVYCRNDKILTFLFRYKNIMKSLRPICGTCTVAVPGIENIDVTPLIKGNHSNYCLLVGRILKQIRFGQPLRSDWNAVDEMALLAEAERKLEDFN